MYDRQATLTMWMRRRMTCETVDRSSRYDDPEAAAADGLWQRD